MRPSLTAPLGLRLLLAGAAALWIARPQGAEAQAEDSFWEFSNASQAEYAEYMRNADQSALASVLPDPDMELDQRLRFAKNAVALYERAAKADPSQGEPHFRAAATLERHYLGGNITARAPLKQAIDHWRAFAEKEPNDPRLREVLNDRSISLTKLYGLDRNTSDLEAAIEDYNQELQLMNQSSPDEAGNIATLLSNRAEVHMMLGRLEVAIAGYEQSLGFANDALAGYGLAVALDRDGQRTRARTVARAVAEADPGNKLTASGGGVFFVPFGELYYYQGMRYEGLADYRRAVIAYREYLRLLPHSPWAPMARRNLAELVPKAGKQPADSSWRQGLPVVPRR